jgi:HEAT repeat protein
MEEGPENTDPSESTMDIPAESTLGRMISGGSAAQNPDDSESDPVVLTEQQTRLLEMSKERRMSKRKMSLDVDVAPHLDVRRFAASLLGGVPQPEVTEALIAVLNSDDSDLHNEALASLAQHGETTGVLPAAAMEPLSAKLASEKSATRVLALRALGWVGAGAGEDILRGCLTDEDALVRAEAVAALGIRGIADKDVENCLNDDYLGVGITAANSLARLRGEDAVDALITFAFRNDGTYRRDIGQLLALHAREAGLRRLTEVLRDDAYVRQRLVVIDALAEIFACRDFPPDLKAA